MGMHVVYRNSHWFLFSVVMGDWPYIFQYLLFSGGGGGGISVQQSTIGC